MKTKSLMKRVGFCLLVSVAAVTFIAGLVGQVQAENPRYGGILKNITTLSPRTIGWPSGDGPPRLPNYLLCMETLLRVDDNGKPVPHLATSFKYGPDRKTLILTIRKGVKFHDGSVLNAEVVKMNLEERKSGGRYRRELRAIESIDAIDEYTVRLNLSEYKNGLLYQFADFNGLMISPKVIEKAKTKEGKKWAARNPVGTGPFKFVKFERNVMLKVEKFDGYWQKGKPYLDGIETHYIFDPMTSMAAMRAGEAHTWWEVPVNKVAELKKHGFDVIIYAERNRGLAGDSANQESIYTDKRIRAAVEYAIDRNAMAKALGYGYWEPMNQYASKKSNGYNPDYKGRPYNPEKAKRLLAEAGYPNGLKIRIVTVTTRQERDIWALIQRYLSKAGIDAEVSFMERGAFFAAANKGLKNALIDFKANMPLDLSKELSTMFMKGSPRLPLMSRPLELQEVLGRAERTPDYATQVSLTKKAVRMISEDALAIPLWIEYVINIKHKSVRDVNYSHAWRYQWTPEDTWLSE